MSTAQPTWQTRWWSWVLLTTLTYLATTLIFCVTERNYFEGVLTASVTLPLLAIIGGVYNGALRLSFRLLFTTMLALVGGAIRFYLFRENFFIHYWFFAACISWIVFGLIAFDTEKKNERTTIHSLITLACPLIPTILLIYFFPPVY